MGCYVVVAFVKPGTVIYDYMKKIALRLTAILIVITGSSERLFGQNSAVFDFVRNDASARSGSMGGAFVSILGDPAGLFYNPATIVSIDSSQASFTFFKHILDINAGSAVIATELEGVGHVAFGVNFTSYGVFERTNREATVTGEFGASDMLITAGWGGDLGEGFSAGIGGSAIFSTIDDVGATALALDGGLAYVDTSRRLSAGLSILHVGTQLSAYGEETEPLPVDLKVGITHTLRGLPLLVSLTFSRLLDEQDQFADRFSSFSIGGELTIAKPVRLRLGYNNRTRQDVPFGTTKGLSGFSGGVGVLFGGYRFDYGFNPLGRIGGLHRVTVNAPF